MQSIQMQMPQQGPYPRKQQQLYQYAQSSQPYQPQPQPQLQQQYSPISRTTTAQTSNNNTSPPPQSKEKRSRRWSLAGRLFDKRKSITQPFNTIPSTSTSTFNNQQQPPLTINTTRGNSNGPYSDEQRVSPVGSGGSGGSSGSGGGHSGGSGGGSHRRSSLADIPKALFNSLRRGSHSSSSETINNNKESVPASAQQQQQQQYQQQQQQLKERIDSPTSSFEGDDNDSTVPEGGEDDQEYARQENGPQNQQSALATILTADGLVQATMAVPKAPPPSHTTMMTRHIPPASVKGILKKRSPPVPTAQQQPPYTKMRPNIINRSSSYDVHPMAGDDGQMGGLLRATDHRARLETSSPVPSHPQLMQSQQQQQQQHQQKPSKRLSPGWTRAPGGIQPLQYPTTRAHYTVYDSYGEKHVGNTIGITEMPPKLRSTVELDDRYMPQIGGGGAAFPPDFTPGMQSNVYQDRGGERSQGEVLDYRTMEMDPSFSFPGAALPPPPVAAAASAAHGYQFHPSLSRAFDQYYYGGAGDAYAGYDQNSSTMDGPQQTMTTMMHDRDVGYGYTSNGGGGGGSYYRSMRNSSGISESTMGILSGNGISHNRPRTIGFTDTIEIIPAHRKTEYNRRSDKYATFKNLTPDLKSEIRDELNTYKMREMAVHVESMGNTAFH
ncbi:hypothetical protein F5H01DRAFT_412925 [Linnemannia elongata]|nr:hypothetical protein F5H01DRAFT_412925 [Linnemannia elongata]